MIGMHSIEVEAYFKQHPLMTSQQPNQMTQIELLHPCLIPASIQATDQSDPAEYFYTPGGSTFTVNPFLVDPPICPVTYECITVTGKNLNAPCDNLADSIVFSPTTGRLTFLTDDMEKYEPGSYIFTMRGTVGESAPISADFAFTLILSNPCPIASLRNLQ